MAVDDLESAISNFRRISRNLADIHQMAVTAAAVYDNIVFR